MFATPRLLAAGKSGFPGFWRRSLDEFRRQATIAINMEGLHVPKKPFPIIDFPVANSIDRCKVMSDRDIGGFSKASLTWEPGDGKAADGHGGEPAHALFKGSISIELPANRPDVQRSGYAAWRTRDRGVWLFGRLLYDIDPYSYLALRVKSDGRKYFVNIQTESIVPTDLHQHLLVTHKRDEWETVTIPFHSFVRTNHGMVVAPQKQMMRQRVRSVGIGLTDRVPGPFELRIADVWATNIEPEKSQNIGESGFELEPESAGGMMDEIEPKRKKGEPERILI